MSRVQQRGAGVWTLCPDCNNQTGSWYVPELLRAVRCAAGLLGQLPANDEADRDPELKRVDVRFGGVRPLRLITQILTMILAVNGAGFARAQEELREFVSDRYRTGLSSRYRTYLVLYRGPLCCWLCRDNAESELNDDHIDEAHRQIDNSLAFWRQVRIAPAGRRRKPPRTLRSATPR
jgi:hypothetical protein